MGLRTIVLAMLLPVLAASANAVEVQTEYKGRTLNGNLELAEGKTLSDGVVLIVHALMQHYGTEIIRGLQEGLKNAGHNSLAVNLSLGVDDRRGSFECTQPHTALFDDAVDEGWAWLQWLRQQGAGSIALMGHSSGANQMLGLAVAHPEPDVSALIMLSPMTTGHTRAIAVYNKRWRADFDAVYVRAKSLIDQGKGEQLMRADFAVCPQAEVTARAFVDYYGGQPLRFDPRSYLRKAELPMQIIVGSDDERQPNVEAFLEPFVDNQKVFLYTIESGGHFFRDLNLEEVVEVTAEFLDGLDGR